jgi:putative mRNA 3-end processing factor
LIDSGFGVDLDGALADDEYLAAILLTHAHSDHYHSLSDSLRDGAPIYTSPGTGAILDLVFEEGAQHQSLGDTTRVVDAVEPIEDWTPIVEDIRVRPIPAGHCPGAAGFLIRFDDSSGTRTMAVTGDFTLTNAGGYPGFPDDLLADVEALVLTGTAVAGNERTEALQTALEHAIGGGPTLLTATGLAGVECAYLLGHLIDELELSVSVVLAGHAAKLYNALAYDVPNVDAVPEFTHTDTVLRSNAVTIAGPQAPTEGASGRLFGVVNTNPAGALVQLLDGGAAPVRTGQCTIHSYQYIPHPSDADIDQLVDRIGPRSIIITHQTKASSRRFHSRYDAVTWADNNTEWLDLFANDWLVPPWMSGSGRTFARQVAQPTATSITVEGDLPLPALDRVETPSLAAEGLDVSAFDTLTMSASAVAPRDVSLLTNADALRDATVLAERAWGGAQESTTTPTETPTPGGERATVQVVDAGDGVTLLRVIDGFDDLQHGETLTVRRAESAPLPLTAQPGDS